jgi:hypothetical protein
MMEDREVVKVRYTVTLRVEKLDAEGGTVEFVESFGEQDSDARYAYYEGVSAAAYAAWREAAHIL